MDLNDKSNDLNSGSNTGGGSPWDESLPPVRKEEMPKIIGTFEPNANDNETDEKPVPFNIPKEIDEQVGKKVEASTVAANDQVASKPEIKIPEPKPMVDPTGKPVSPTPEAPKPMEVPPTPVSAKPEKKKSGILNIFGKKPKNPVIPNPVAPAAKPLAETPVLPKMEIPPVSQPLPPTPPPVPIAPSGNIPPRMPNIPPKTGPQFSKQSKPSLFKKPGFVITFSAILLFTALTFLTEAGIISVGIEKIYGIVGLENLWGGLGRNPERALMVAASNTKSHPNFKIKGSLSLTVNKTINSNVTSPLVSMINLPIALKDVNVGNKFSGVLAQYEDYYPTDSTSTDSGSSSSSSSTSPTDTSSSSSSITDTTSSTDSSTTDASSTGSFLGDQSQYPGYQETETTIKEMNFDFVGASNEKSVTTDITVKKLVGAEGKVSLVNSGNDLYVKSSNDIKFDEKADVNKWLNYKIASLDENDNSVSKLFSAKPDQNFSIIGTRVANEKIDGVRCYNYRIDKLEIGGILDGMGIKSEMIQKIDGNIWLGVADHLVHRVKIVIIPSISSSVTRAEIDLSMYGFDVENDITIPSLSDKININGSEENVPPAAATAPVDTTPTESSAVQNDNVRKSNLASIKAALQAYKQKTGKFPVSSALTKLSENGNIVAKSVVPTYIASLPADPNASGGWYYAYTSDGKTFRLSARFENLSDPQISKVGDIYLHYVYND